MHGIGSWDRVLGSRLTEECNGHRESAAHAAGVPPCAHFQNSL